MRGKKMSQAMAFIVLFGIVSLFSDMTHEGASSIRGAYLALLGASAGTIGFISGLGEQGCSRMNTPPKLRFRLQMPFLYHPVGYCQCSTASCWR